MSDKDYIARCREQIEKELNLDPANLMERDYEYLHEVILERTKTDLSTSTLRRLWMDKYQGVPQIKTLDALAQVLGYSGWHAYKSTISSKPSVIKRSNRTLFYITGVLVLAVAATILLTSTGKAIGEVKLDPEVIVYDGVPATIGFNYLVSNPGVEIELSWNPYERAKLDPSGNFYTGTYYYPDYHQAKLLFKEQVLAWEFVHVTTKGWHALIMDSGMDTHPQYVDSADFIYSDKLAINDEVLKNAIDKSEDVYSVFTLSNTSLGQLSGDHFSLVANVEMSPMPEGPLCLIYEVLIKGSSGNIRIPVTQPGCYGVATLHCAEKRMTGKLNDLSNVSTDLTLPHQVKISCQSKMLSVEVGSNQPFELSYEEEIGQLKVIKFIFNGLPEITAFELKDEHNKKMKVNDWYPFNE